jgi:hypothetical protein
MGDRFDYGNNIEGVPLPGDIPQVIGSSAPNRDHSPTLRKPEGEPENEAPLDYVKKTAEQRHDEPFVPSKDADQWSSGIDDEENSGYMSFSDVDEEWPEGLFPETEPLTIEGQAQAQSSEEFSDIELKPDNIQYGPE